MKTVKKKSEREKFSKELNEYLKEFDVERNIIVMGNINAKVGNERIEVVVAKWKKK